MGDRIVTLHCKQVILDEEKSGERHMKFQQLAKRKKHFLMRCLMGKKST